MPPADLPTTPLASAPAVFGHGSPAADDPVFGLPSSSSSFLSAPSLPSYPSPLRQHRRTPSQHREIKETLNAVSEFADSEDNGHGHHTINQYTIQAMIGRGSYGAVHLATDQYGKQYAIKEFSKARLRKHLRYSIMKKGPARCDAFTSASPSAMLSQETQAEAKDALYLIRKEIAIMKKLNHPNLVELIEVLDDPEQDSLYMVLEMCKKGVIMAVGLGKKAQPYSLEACRCWFRDLILGIEYLHAQNIIHRDIKPDNLLITEDDVLKIGDFGVSEIFEKADGMRTNKQVGSPAFLPPELCVSNHGEVSGPACDIWSMGVTLYCLRYGSVPFEHDSVPDTYHAITNESVALPEDEDAAFVDLMRRILEKDPNKRIAMPELRNHPWVTLQGSDPLLSAEENCANLIEPPNALELNHAITQRMSHLFCVLKAIAKFKGLLHSHNHTSAGRSDGATGPSTPHAFSSQQSGPSEDVVMVTEDEVARLVEERRQNIRKASLQSGLLLGAGGGGGGGSGGVPGGRAALWSGADVGAGGGSSSFVPGSGPAVMGEQPPVPVMLLGIGTGGRGDEFGAGADRDLAQDDIVSESPTAAGFDVYDHAFQSELQRIRAQSSSSSSQNPPAMYLTRLIEQTHGSALARSRYLGSAGDEGSNDDGPLGSPGRKLTTADAVARAMRESKP